MKKTAKSDDKTNFSRGVRSGFGAMKNRIGFTILGVVVGLVCGFKWANYNYREKQNAATREAASQAAAKVSSQPNAAAQAMDIIKKARENANDFELQRQAAEQFMQIQRPAGALPFLQQANKLKPEDVEVMADLAGVYLFQQQYTEAISWARKGLAKDANHPQSKFYLLYSMIESNQNLNEAEKLLNELDAAAKAKGLTPDAQQAQALADVRRRLQEARQGKTTLQHGPDAKDAVKGEVKGEAKGEQK